MRFHCAHLNGAMSLHSSLDPGVQVVEDDGLIVTFYNGGVHTKRFVKAQLPGLEDAPFCVYAEVEEEN